MSFDNVEDVLALTPTQQGVLVHGLEQPDSDVYLSQLVATLGAALDLDRFRAAWDELVSRHAALRTAFLWDGLDEPLQVVRETVEIEWTILDAPSDSLANDDAAWAERLAADRARGFALDAAPLLRMTLAPRADGGWRWAWTFHHLILDGWSARHLLDELRSIVAARRRGEAPSLSAPFAWREMVAWHAARDPSAGEAFWRDELEGFDRPTRLDLPASRGSGSGRVRRVLPPTFGDALRRAARAHGLTVATVVQGAWAIVVSRWAREDDVVFGITQALRPPELAGVEQGVGLFIATVPLRARLDPAAPVADWLRELQRRQVAARRWASTPLATIQRCAELPAGESLLDHLLVIESHPGGEEVGPLELACADLDILERSHYPLAVLVLPGETPELLAIHDRRRIGERTAARLLDHLAAMLDQIVGAPEAPMRDLALGDVDARRRVLGEWSGSETERPADERIDHVIARIARDHGERTALIHDGERTSYRALLGRADRLALSLRERGVGADVPVALRVERSTELIVGLLAILRAGGAYVPIDPAYPAAHHRRVLEDVTPPVVVARGPCPDALSSWADAWLDLDALDPDALDPDALDPDALDLDAPVLDTLDLAEAHAAGSGGDPAPETGPEHLAYILYTSGSTGEPKGVMVEHRQLVRSTAARSRVYPEPLGRFLLLSSIAFDSSVAGLFWTLTTGGTLVLPSDDAIHEPDRLRALIAAESVTHTLALPALYRVLLDAGPPEPLASLAVVVVAGEACPPDLVAHHRRRLPSARLVNEYGPTEGTVWATVHELGPADVDGPVPIGRPIPNARVAVLDHHDQPAPVGVAGELVIAGDGVTRGYWRRADATAERFVDLELAPWGEATRVYRTGDLVRWRADGVLCFLGRLDEQVKVRGHRVELAGVEARLVARREVADAAVTLEPTASGAARLVAWVVPAGDASGLDGLRDRLVATLPEPMVPSLVRSLDALPRRPNGKVDRRRLAALAAIEPPDRPASIAELTDPIERTIATIWRQVLGVDAIALDDEFVALGGDSILGIQVVSRLRQEGLPAEPRDLGRHRTLGALASALRRRSAGSGADATSDGERDDGTGEAPLLPIQAWFFDRDLPAPHHWNLSARFAVAADVTTEHLTAALDACVAHHDALRARFVRRADGGWRQTIPASDDGTRAVPRVAVTHEADRWREVEALQASLDLEHGPLIRSLLIESRDSDGDEDEPTREWWVAAHHLVVDAVSWTILADDLELAVARAVVGDEIVLPSRTTSVKRWAEHLAARAAGEDGAAWACPDAVEIGRLPAGSPVEPHDGVEQNRAFQPITEGEARTHRQRLTPDLTGRLLVAAAAGGVGLDRVVLAALAMAVAPWRDATRWRLAVERHGREAPSGFDLTRTVGWFTVSHPLTIELPSLDASPAEALAAARAAFDRVPGDGAGLGILRAHGDAATRARSSELPEPELLLNVLGRRPASSSARRLRPLDGAHLGARDPRQPRSHRLELNARVDGDRLQVDWIHADRDLAIPIVDALATRFATALDRLADALAGGSPVDALGWPADASARLGDAAEIEDVHPLSSAQEALLVHRLQDPEHDSGVVVLRARWRGAVDVERFAAAWRRVVARHPVLRSAVRWRDLPHPVQVVAHAVEVPVTVEDWRDRSATEQDRAWDEQLDRIRRVGLDLGRAPVLSVVLIRVGEDEYRLAWACHHVLLDGWSSGWVLREVLDHVRGIDLGPEPQRFRDHVAWTRARRPTADAVRAGFDPRRVLDAPRVTGTAWQGGGRADRARRVELLADGSRLADWARRHGVTVASVVLGCWGLVLTEATASQTTTSQATASRTADGPTAVLGFTAAGRGLDLEGLDADGIDRRIGLFAGVLPLVVTVDPEATPSAWIGTVFEQQQGLQALAPWPLRELFELAGTALRRPPFDTLVAVANFLPSASTQPSDGAGVHLDALRGDVTAALPLTLAVVEDGALVIEARWDARWLDDGDVAGWLDRLASLVRTLVEDDAPTVRDWLDRAPGRAPSAARSNDPARAARPLGGTGAEAATTATEAHVMRLWNDLLAVQEYGRDDSFFDLGGQSLAVARMLARINQDFGVELPLGVVFEQPTVRGVAAAIDARDARRSWAVRVPIRVPADADAEPPLFMVHGLGGEVGWFYDLANGLDPRVPLIGLQAPPEPLDTVRAIAAHYVDAVREVQPRGPYRLGGYCIGGGVAYEMASQLRDAGEAVPVLVLIDSVPQAHIAEQQASPAVGRRLQRLLAKEPAEIVRSTRDAARRAGRRLVATVRSAAAGDGAEERPLELDDVLDMATLPEVYHEISRRHFRAMRDYRPAPYDGDAWLLRTADERFGEDFGWGALVAGRLTVERVPGRHVDVLKEPHVQVVARLLDALLTDQREHVASTEETP